MFELDQPAGIGILCIIAFDKYKGSTGGIGIVFAGEPPRQCLGAQIQDGNKLIVPAYTAFFYLADMHYFTSIILNRLHIRCRM